MATKRNVPNKRVPKARTYGTMIRAEYEELHYLSELLSMAHSILFMDSPRTSRKRRAFYDKLRQEIDIRMESIEEDEGY